MLDDGASSSREIVSVAIQCMSTYSVLISVSIYAIQYLSPYSVGTLLFMVLLRYVVTRFFKLYVTKFALLGSIKVVSSCLQVTSIIYSD